VTIASSLVSFLYFSAICSLSFVCLVLRQKASSVKPPSPRTLRFFFPALLFPALSLPGLCARLASPPGEPFLSAAQDALACLPPCPRRHPVFSQDSRSQELAFRTDTLQCPPPIGRSVSVFAFYASVPHSPPSPPLPSYGQFPRPLFTSACDIGGCQLPPVSHLDTLDRPPGLSEPFRRRKDRDSGSLK